MLESGSACGMPLVPPSQPTQAPLWVAITGRSAVTRPPGDSSQPSSPCWTGSRLATTTTGLFRASRRATPEVGSSVLRGSFSPRRTAIAGSVIAA